MCYNFLTINFVTNSHGNDRYLNTTVFLGKFVAIHPKHLLWRLKPVVIGKTDANDAIIVHLSDG